MDSPIQLSEVLLQEQEEMVEIQVDHLLPSLELDHGSRQKIYFVLELSQNSSQTIQMDITTPISETPTGM